MHVLIDNIEILLINNLNTVTLMASFPIEKNVQMSKLLHRKYVYLYL